MGVNDMHGVLGVPRALLPAIGAAAISFGVCGIVVAGDQTYLDVPRVTATAPAVFRDRLLGATKGVVRIVMLGDSQEYEPAGWGDLYIANLNARFAEVFGAPSESQLFTNTWAVSTPRWLGCVRPASASVPSMVQLSALLPGCRSLALVDNPKLEFPDSRFLLLQDAARTRDESLDGGQWIADTWPFHAEVLAVTGPRSSTFAWRSEPTEADFPSSGPSMQQGLLSTPAKTAAGQFVWLETPVLAQPVGTHPQLVLRGVSPMSSELIGVRFRSTGPAGGVVVQSFAKGGMRALDYLTDHQEAGGMLRALSPSLVVLHFGTNDAHQLASADEWAPRMAALIQMIREQAKDPSLPIILASDLRCGSTPLARSIVDRMPAVAHEIALSDPNVLALNIPRISEEEYGWGASDFHRADPVHFQPYAQRFLARAFVGELLEALDIPDPDCSEADWADCVRTWGAACLPEGCRVIMSGDADASGVQWAGPGTRCDDQDGDGEADACESSVAADINGDGLVDAADLTAILLAWGTSNPAADITGDGLVDAADLANLLLAWGQ
jgi:lysophospholipase L1-like esterase